MAIRSEKIAITLDKALAAKVEIRRRSTGESRSAYIARAVATQTAHEEEQRKMDQYRRALEATPETEEVAEPADATQPEGGEDEAKA